MESTRILTYAAQAAKQPVQPLEYDPGALGPDEVRIDITHCGICASDVSMVDDEFGMSTFPLVGGHEIVGTIAAVGGAVSHLTVGQRVGVGPYRAACLHCACCTGGRENLCQDKQLTIMGHHGGFANAIQLSAAFAFPLPDALASELAAPLLCAGLTVYAPIARHSSPTSRVGVIGMGGLGHLAIQIASRRGSEVTVFSTSPSKEEEAKRFGADHFINIKDPQELAGATGTIDLLLSTTYAAVQWSSYLPVLRPDGHLCNVGASMSPIDIPAAMLTLSQLTISGSAAGSRKDMIEMLAFCARHRIAPQIERMPMTEINAALDRVRNREARYRMVLEWS